eukprot:jgi/Mesvir1/16369/Mv18116-RA.1
MPSAAAGGATWAPPDWPLVASALGLGLGEVPSAVLESGEGMPPRGGGVGHHPRANTPIGDVGGHSSGPDVGMRMGGADASGYVRGGAMAGGPHGHMSMQVPRAEGGGFAAGGAGMAGTGGYGLPAGRDGAGPGTGAVQSGAYHAQAYGPGAPPPYPPPYPPPGAQQPHMQGAPHAQAWRGNHDGGHAHSVEGQDSGQWQGHGQGALGARQSHGGGGGTDSWGGPGRGRDRPGGVSRGGPPVQMGGPGAPVGAGRGRVVGGPPLPFRPMTKVCSFYNSPQGCRNGSECTFIHEDKNS